MIGPLISQGMSFLGNKLFPKDDSARGLIDAAGSVISDKVNGIPTPITRDGSEQGRDYLGFMNEAFPGTTPWERLGANSPMGAISSAEIAKESAMKMQDKELDNRARIADSTNRAHVISSLGSVSPMAARTGLQLLDGMPGDDYDSDTQQRRERLPYETSKLDADTKITRERTPRESLIGDISDGVRSVFAGAGSFAGTHLTNAEDRLKDFIRNSGRKPRRFGI